MSLRLPLDVSGRLPDFPWDKLSAYGETARAHPDGIVDLSVGTPVDPTPEVVQHALAEAADSPGYPATIGRPETRHGRRRGGRLGQRGLFQWADRGSGFEGRPRY